MNAESFRESNFRLADVLNQDSNFNWNSALDLNLVNSDGLLERSVQALVWNEFTMNKWYSTLGITRLVDIFLVHSVQ